MKPFLTCNWENLLYINYEIDPELVVPFLPEDIEPALFGGKTSISLVSFEFSHAKFLGCKIPFHQFFPEINLRMYVQRKDNPALQGVYFISEMVPKIMTVLVAKYIFGEAFSLQKIRQNKTSNFLQYQCATEQLHLNFSVNFKENLQLMPTDLQHFIIEKEFAFCGKKGGKSKLFQVVHQKWNLYQTENPKISIKKMTNIPEVFQKIICSQAPISVFATDGSFVEVFNLN